MRNHIYDALHRLCNQCTFFAIPFYQDGTGARMISFEVCPPMLDIHLPHKSIHGFSEFLLHLFTITVGLLIAVQIESFVEWRHHLHLAEEARVALRAEIENNLKVLRGIQPGLKDWRDQIDADLAVTKRIQEHPNDPAAQHGSLAVRSGGVTLDDTAWRTAQSTGALAYMPYEEAEEYASIYQAQTRLLTLEEKPAEEFAALIGLLAKFHSHREDIGKLNAEQASAFAEYLGQMRAQMADSDTQVQNTIEKSSAFLEHRKAREDLETKVN
jgi:hypothetical protein